MSVHVKAIPDTIRVSQNETPPSDPGRAPASLRDPVFGDGQPDGLLGRLGRYSVIKLLDCGGMGAVYLASDEGLGRHVALKVLLPDADSPTSRKRFFREARITSGIKHPSVVTIYEVGEDRGIPFIAMELLEGMLLGHYLTRKQRLTVSQAVRIGVETARGLAAAHALGLIHRDIKPGNLWLEAPKGRVRILDFGIARRIDADPSRGLTDTNIVVGTPDYMSPEQSLGKRLDHRSDLFSLGAVLYELVTGRAPFQGETALTVLASLALDEPPAVRSLNPSAPPELEAIIHRLLSKKPEARPASAAVVAGELQALGNVSRSRVPRISAKLPGRRIVERPTTKTDHQQPRPKVFEGLGDNTVDRADRARVRVGWGVWIALAALSLATVLLAVVVVSTSSH